MRLTTENGPKMSRLELIFIFVLQFEAGISGEEIFLYNRVGQKAILACGSASYSTCSNILWLYNRDQYGTEALVPEGKFRTSSARLSLGTDCSLVINNITEEDFGLYTCRQGRNIHQDRAVYLSLLTISPSPPTHADPKRNDEVILKCSLLKYSTLDPCPLNSLRWVDETGAVLLDEGVGYKFLRQMNCEFYLSVKRQSGHNRRYTCQLVNKEGNIEMEADYTPVFTAGRRDSKSEKYNPDAFPDQTYIIIGAVVGVVVVLVVIAAVLIKHRRRAKVAGDVQKPTQHPDEPESNVTYATVNHANQRTSPQKKVIEEEQVTYSAVKTPVKTEDNDPSSLYSCVSKPKITERK